MEQPNTVRFVEEEKFGWTILSSVVDVDPASKTNDTEKVEGVNSGEHNKESIEAEQGDLDLDLGMKDEGEGEETINYEEEKGLTLDHEEKASEDVVGAGDEGSHDYDGQDESQDGTREEEHNEDEMELFYFEDPQTDLTWRPRQRHTKYAAKQALVQHAGPKQGLIWRASLVATLGLFGWVILSGLSGGGKNFRCLKLHPCSIKEGEPVIMNSV